MGVLCILGVFATASACGAPAPPGSPHARPEASWQDVFDGIPPLYAVVRPQALKRDPIYGPFFGALLRLAEARSQLNGVTAIEALAGSEEIVVGIGKKGSEGEDAAIIFRGVPANLDPARMTDSSGELLVRPVDERVPVPEFELRDPTRNEAARSPGSLFVLPGRTWVVAVGAARLRARQAFRVPSARPIPKVDADALAVMRLEAERLGPPGSFGGVTRKLASIVFSLAPGKTGLVATLQYADEDSSVGGEQKVKQLLGALAKDETKRFEWLSTGKVNREGSRVLVNVALPPRLLEELPKASGHDL